MGNHTFQDHSRAPYHSRILPRPGQGRTGQESCGSVRNFRDFEQQELNFAPQFNVLIGDNATGKTAVLEALAMGAGSWFLGIRGAPARQIREADPRVAGRLVSDQFTYEKQWPVQITCTGEVGGEFVAWTRSLSGKKGRPPQRSEFRLYRVVREAMRRMLQGADELRFDWATTAPISPRPAMPELVGSGKI